MTKKIRKNNTPKARRLGNFRTTQGPLKLSNMEKRELRTQFGALCYRVQNGKVQVLLITSRRTGRWIIPKGWPEQGISPAECARREAWEEAGATGKMHEACNGIYAYTKSMGKKDDLPCMVAVFPMRVRKVKSNYPEAQERRRKWFSRKKAAKRVAEGELRRILLNFDPVLLD